MSSIFMEKLYFLPFQADMNDIMNDIVNDNDDKRPFPLHEQTGK